MVNTPINKGIKLKSLAIDESNNKQDPTIYVGVVSTNVWDAKRIKQKLPKQRNKPVKIFPYLKDRDFYYLIINHSQYAPFFHTHTLKVIAITELIKKAHMKNHSIDEVLFDGYLEEKSWETIGKIIYPIPTPKLTVETKLDVTVPLVNMADNVAHRLFKDYTKKDRQPQMEYLEHICTPRIEDYLFLCKKVQGTI